MDVSHLILGRPWEYDRKIIHDDAKNSYQFIWEMHQILLLPTTEPLRQPLHVPVKAQSPVTPYGSRRVTSLLCSYAAFEQDLRQEGHASAIFTMSGLVSHTQWLVVLHTLQLHLYHTLCLTV